MLAVVPLGAAACIVAASAASAPAGPVYDPPAGVYPYFPSSPFLERIPDPAPTNPQSAAWVADGAATGRFELGDLHAYYSRTPNRHELAFPVYLDHAGSDTPVRIHCIKAFGGSAHPCNIEGMTVNIDERELPQNGGNPPGEHLDAHWALIDPAGGYEYDTWQTQWPPRDGVLTVGWGGRCALAGNGFTNPSYSGPHWNSGCAGDASGTPLSMGIVRVKDLLEAARSGGALPAALSLAYGCTGPARELAAPFLSGGDGHCPGAVPEGTRLYLAMHDAQIDALGLSPVLAVILRTLDEDHYGGFIVDSESGRSPGFGINVESDETYAAWGLASPWMSAFVSEARRQGLNVYDAPLTGRAGIRLELPPSIGWDKVRFL